MLATMADGGGDRHDGEVIGVRTNTYDDNLHRFIEDTLLPTGRRVVVLVDERTAPVATPPGREKIVLHPEAQGLHVGADAMWRCGDYFLYAAMAALPDMRHLWLIEPDVRIHGRNPTALFDGADPAGSRADFITAWFVTASPGWSWYATITPFYPTTCNCMLQLARFSRPFIAALFAARVALSRRFAVEARAPEAWPNDEAFIGAVAHARGFRVATLKEHAPGFQTEGSFTFLRPTSGTILAEAPTDERIYHPVLFGEPFHRRARLYLHERTAACSDAVQLVGDLPSAFIGQVMAELGSEAGRTFYEDVKDAARRLSWRAAVA